jgi:RND superfamily putative drug exporter
VLTNLTRLSIRRPLVTVAVWVAAVVGCFIVGVGVFNRLESNVGVVTGSESDRAQSMLAQAQSEPVTITAVIDGGGARDATVAAVADLRRVPGVIEVTDPLPSANGHTLLVRILVQPADMADQAARAVAQRLRRIDTAQVIMAGGPLTDNEFNEQAQADVQRAELLTTPVVLLLLLLVFGGLRAAGLPLLVAVAGVGGTFGVLYGFSLVGDVSVYAIQVATMLSVGLAVDYGLLTVSRFREERTHEPDVAAAVIRTGAAAGHTVVFSGLTVAAVLAGLLVFPDPFLRSMGLAGVAVVAVVVAATLTLLPALLRLLGHHISPAKAQVKTGVFARIARAVQRRPAITALAATGVMVVLSLPVLDLRLGQVDARLLPTATQTRQLYDAIAADYPDLNRPNPVVIVAAAPVDSPAVTALRERVATVPHVTTVDTDAVGPVTVLRARLDRPSHTDAAHDAVAAIRSIPTPFEMAVTGDTAMLVDYQAMLADRLPYAVAIIALGTLLLLFWFTRSILLPVKAILTNLLSIGAALGAVVFVFQQGHLANWLGTEGVDATHLSVPVLVGAIAFALSIDYEMFLLSRIRERWLAGADTSTAVADGLQHTGRIITSAALLLAVVFAGFLVAGFVPVKAIGLGLVLAVALDATLVRLVLVPATMTLMGRYNWWTPRLRRRSCPVPATPRRSAFTPVRRYLSTQARSPHGLGGRFMGRFWIRETAAANDAAIDLLAPVAGEHILELGFGPGRTVARLADTGCHVVGVDASRTMVAAATRRNADHIAAGRVQLHHGDGITLPVPDGSVDGVISVHTIYFWPRPAETLTGFVRALRPGGRIVLALRPGEYPLPGRLDPAIYHVPTTTQAVQWLHEAGFTDVRTENRPDAGPILVWLVASVP